MENSWEPINMLPADGRTALFVRSVNPAGNPIHFVTPAGLSQVEGHVDEDGVFQVGSVKEAIEGEEIEQGWQPTHFFNDVSLPVTGRPKSPTEQADHDHAASIDPAGDQSGGQPADAATQTQPRTKRSASTSS